MNKTSIGYMILAAEADVHLPSRTIEKLAAGMQRQMNKQTDLDALAAVARYADVLPGTCNLCSALLENGICPICGGNPGFPGEQRILNYEYEKKLEVVAV